MDLKCEKFLNGRKEQDLFYLFIGATLGENLLLTISKKYNSHLCLVKAYEVVHAPGQFCRTTESLQVGV